MLLATIAEDVGVNQVNPRLAKKLHVLAALEVERYRKATLDLTMTRGGGTDIAQATDRADGARRAQHGGYSRRGCSTRRLVLMWHNVIARP